MARRTKEEAEETRTLILDTAERVFHEKGVSRTSLADIAQAAGVTRGAIYWHFKNKLDLFNAMMERATLPMEEIAETAAALADEDPLAHLRHTALAVLTSACQDPHTRLVFEIVSHKCELVDELASARDRQLECRALCLADMEQGFRKAIRHGQLPRTVNARRAAIGMHALVDGLISNWVLDPALFSLRKDGEKIVDSYLSGLAAAAVPT